MMSDERMSEGGEMQPRLGREKVYLLEGKGFKSFWQLCVVHLLQSFFERDRDHRCTGCFSSAAGFFGHNLTHSS